MKVCYFSLWGYPCPYKGAWTTLFRCWRASRIKAKATKKRTRNNLANVWHVPKSGVQVDDLLHPHDDYQCWPVKQWLPLCSPYSVIKHIVSKKSFPKERQMLWRSREFQNSKNSFVANVSFYAVSTVKWMPESSGSGTKNCRLLMMTQKAGQNIFCTFWELHFLSKDMYAVYPKIQWAVCLSRIIIHSLQTFTWSFQKKCSFRCNNFHMVYIASVL